MYPQENVQDAETVESVELDGETVDIDKELGIEPAESNEQYDDDTDKPA
jgi:hypothetical protein